MLEQFRSIIKALRINLQNSDFILGLGMVFILLLIIVPLPGFILDGLIALSLLSGMLILLTALGVTSPAEFSAFPTLLLVTTIYRIAVNVSTTRMILTKGAETDSALVSAFGTFVVGGSGISNYVIGVIIFLILTLVQIMVITKGATRVSEVAARFALDGMVGKQLAIDTDLQAGHIDEREARKRREELHKESAFYGAMDGSSKFVQGDVRLGLIIVAINILGGLIVGVGIRGESFTEALEIYTKFTIGDGLAAQIPALLISVATGVIVARSVSDNDLPTEIRTQLMQNPQTLYITGGILVLGGLLPGFPMLSMFVMGGGLLFLGYQVDKAQKGAKDQERQKEEARTEERKPESYLQQLKAEPLEVEIGYNLIPLVDPKNGGTMLDQISRLRRRFATEIGLIVPPVRIRDNLNLKPGEYVVKLQGSVMGGGDLEVDKLMAIDTGRVQSPLEGYQSFKEPTYNLNAFWISPEQKSEAESSGYDVVDPSTVIATHLTNIIQQNSHEIMGRQEIKSILDSVREDSPVVVDEVLSDKKVGLGQLQAVLQNLLKENVSIRNMPKILEAIANQAEQAGKDPYLMTEAVRQHLRRQIVGEYMDENKRLYCITIDPQIDRRLREGIHRDPEEGFVMALKPEFQMALRDALLHEYQAAQKRNRVPIFLASRSIRAGIFYILERQFPARNFAVLAHEEIPQDVRTEVEGQVTLRREEKETEEGAA